MSDEHMSDELMTPRRLADDYVERLAALDPMTAVWLGLNPGDDRQPDLSPQGYDARAELAAGTLAALDRLEKLPHRWQGPDRDCARLLRERLGAELAGHAAGDHFRQVRNINSPLIQLRSIFAMMPTDSEQDWQVVAGRLAHLPGALEQYRTTLAEGMSRGLLSAPRQVTTVIGQLDAWTGRDAAGVDWFADFVADGSERLRPRLDGAARAATAAVGEFRQWLHGTYLPAVAEVPDAVGPERYRRSARLATGSDVDVAEAYGWAWEEFHRTVAEMRAESGRVLPGASIAQAREHLDAHGHVIEGEEAIRVWLQQIMDEAIEALDGAHFDISGPLRRVESRIAPSGSSAAPYYAGPSLDFSRPGRTYLPTMGRDSFRTWRLVSTWYHEGVPGHHLQLAQWVASADRLSRYQVSLGKVSANVEGWALYAERLMDELGFLTDPGRRLGYLGKQLMRIIRVIIDTGMHLGLVIPADSGFHPGERWTPQLADAFMAEYLAGSAAHRTSEITRYLGWPGQAIGYKLGERAWLRGRQAAERRQGADFDLKAWHMKALAQGSYGLDDLPDALAVL
ncbi:DUF885 domain-containing protein [Kitasatospora nipponensis]|uniref:DUF885 domain-containing protein n=1 Tax=Kitasatospora nipponensis TaxID=258049 RepID=A0ABP4H431_9ACTN